MSCISFNNDWKFCPEYKKDMELPQFNDTEFESVRIPHSVSETPYNYFNENVYQKIAIYRKRFTINENLIGKRAILHFDGVAHKCEVYINGILALTHFGGYTAFDVDISPYVVNEMDNVLAVICDSRENLNIPPFGSGIDYMTYGGIYREVTLEIKNENYIEDIYVFTQINPCILKSQITFNFSDEDYYGYTAEALLKDSEDNVLFALKAPVSKSVLHLNRIVENVRLWSVDSPNLYTLTIKLLYKGFDVDEKTIRFGFRTAEFKKDGFYLNGNKLKLIGLNRHQSYPYVGYAMPKSAQEQDADILKNELCVNTVRTSHYPQSQHFINRCDEIGLLVITEIPGWQYIGDEYWKMVACENVAEMIIQYRNHPSVILWGVRINESADDDEFYERTNKIAHSLDSSRATTGIRNNKKGHLLEDVYAYNDFSHNGINPGLQKKEEVTSNIEKPYFVTEFGGHMYPAKSFDNEEHRLLHAIRHVSVINDMLGQDDIAGCLGWCMFDYNTHKEFGSGDRICYHGVMDMFRNPKPASYVYSSQGNENPILYVTSGMEIGDHKDSEIGDFYVFTNADSVRVYKNSQMIKEYYKTDSPFTNMQHPPILINDRVGNLIETNEGFPKGAADELKSLLFGIKENGGADNLPAGLKIKQSRLMKFLSLTADDINRMYTKYLGNWEETTTDYIFEAIKDNKVVATVKKQPMTQTCLRVRVDKTKLIDEDTYDVASIRIEAMDENYNRLYYCNAPVVFETEGNVEVIGPNIVSLIGGATGTYIKTIAKGTGKLKIKAINEEYTINFDIK